MKNLTEEPSENSSKNSNSTQHIPVLLKETIENLKIGESDIVVDCTLGTGGHGLEICKLLGKDGVYIGIDLDEQIISTAKNKLKDVTEAKIIFVKDNFRNLKQIITGIGVGKINKILIDLGWNYIQLGLGKGFSFNDTESLHMTYGDPSDYEFTGYEVVNHWGEKNIADIVYYYGGEVFSKRIAKAIVRNRPIYDSHRLAEVVSNSVPIRTRLHPATKTFQAIRIVVNDEIRAITDVLDASQQLLEHKAGNRLAIISFHSGEDRLIKTHFKNMVKSKNWQLVNKKIIKASKDELSFNKRSRSAKLRVIEKI